MRAVRLRQALAFASLVALASCVDSELTGVADTIPPFDTLLQDLSQDVPGPDASDTSRPDGVDAGCTADAQCASVLGTLGLCDVPRCEATTGVCYAERREDCCVTTADCPLVRVDCLEYTCPVPGQACVPRDTCTTCQLDSDCLAAAPACTQPRCSEGTCFFEPVETCCTTAADCSDADLCTADRCADGLCTFGDVGGPGCCTAPKVIDTSFNPAPAFSVDSTDDTLTWSVLDTAFTPSPPAALYLGDPNTYSLAGAAPNAEATAEFRLGTVAPGAVIEVKFQAYHDLPTGATLGVFVHYLDEGRTQHFWTSTEAPSAVWTPVKLSRTAAGRGPAVLWLAYAGHGAADPTRFGALLDDLQVRTACGVSLPCTSDDECLTAAACQEGRCGADGQCAYAPIPGCCTSPADCPASGNACFKPDCQDSRCIERPVPGCCTTDLDCGPSPDPCAVRTRCDGGTCALVPAPVDCDDGDACTADACTNGACQHTAIPGCCVGPDCACQPDVARYTFEQASEGWTFDAPVSGYGWRRVEVQSVGSPRVLFFGNPDAGPAFDPGFPMTAVASSPPIALPATAQSITVTFQAFVGVDASQTTDSLRLEAVGAAGQTAVLWQLSATTPRYEVIDLQSTALTGLAGQVIQLRFVYAATDNLRADGFGFLADDVEVTAVCAGPQCVSPASCPTGPACTTRTCTAGVCGLAPVSCDDNDPCTSDLCDATTGQCTHTPSGLPGCGGCQTDAQCQDGDACTRDRCVQGQCVNFPDPTLPGCGTGCTSAAQCQDGDPCTRDRCVQGACQNVPDTTLPGCGGGCTSAAQCNDQDPCTSDICRPDGLCANPYNPDLPGCTTCQIDLDCQDGDACTRDRCAGGQCQHIVDATLPGCTPTCNGPADCQDGQVCTQDICTADGYCAHPLIPGCCTANTQCNDNDVCTADRCDLATGACSHTPIDSDACSPTCVAADCDDQNPCTADSCNSFTGACDHVAIAGCCTAQAQCADGDYCTLDQCANNVCTHTALPLPGCGPECTTDAQCDDGNACTTNRCGSNGTCQTSVIFGCCDNAGDCNDQNACTTDTCLATVGVCFNAPIGCNDQNACTLDSCSPTTGCVFTPDPDCCTSAADCDDGNTCTIDGCAGGRCVHAGDATCCTSDADCTLPQCAQGTCAPDGQCLFTSCCETGPTGILCDDGDSCTADACGIDGVCTHVAEAGCCNADDDCPEPADCTIWTCDAAQHQCVSADDPSCCQEQTVASYAFSTNNLSGWTIQPTQAPGTVTWWVSTRRAASPPSSLYMGNPTTGNYDNGGIPRAYATTPALTLPASAVGLEMSFKVWLDLETYADFDPFFIDVVRQNGSTVTVWNKTAVATNQYRSWVDSKINLTPYAGQTIRIRFRFEADDALLNQTEGIFIDDIAVRVTCSPVTTCNGDSECNDGDACTTDRCVGNVCQATAIAGCCEGAADCNDSYACTTDTCVNNKCLNALIPNCCVYDGECNDNRTCTQDACNASTHTCLFVDTGGCCATAADCQDGDACTSDVCLPSGECYHGANTADPTCCVPGTYFSDAFPSQVLTNFTVSGDGSEVRWRIFNGQVASPPFAMYYGNPATRNYDTGARTYGTATTGDIAIPTSAHAPTLAFNVWLDLGSFFFDDLLSVRVLSAGNAYTVWERTQLPFGSQRQWIPVTVNLPAQVVGGTIRVQFAFDSIDEQGNQGEGIYIDDVVVSSTCAP